MRFDLSAVGTFKEIESTIRSIIQEWAGSWIGSNCGNDKYNYTFTECDDLYVNNDGCRAIKPEIPRIDFKNEVFRTKQPYQIAGSLFESLKFLVDTGRAVKMKMDQVCHELAIDVCTMTEYMHHVRKGKEDHTLIDMAVNISPYGSTSTTFVLADGSGNVVESGSTGWDGFDLKPEIFLPNVGYGMRWAVVDRP